MANKTFYVGFASAGAISAGAYSAGVLDFLIYALDEWEQHRTTDEHHVVLPVFSGASAGSITSAVGILAATRQKGLVRQAGQATHYLQALYDCWVVCPDLTSSPRGAMLDVDDLQGDEPVASLLNSKALDAIAEHAFKQLALLPQTLPAYFPQRLHLYMTQTNMRGIPYGIDFGGNSGYAMLCHADRAHYRIDGLGSAAFVSTWADADQGFPVLNSGSLTPVLPAVWQDYIQHTLASGAFPVGLRARSFATITQYYDNRMWPLPLPTDTAAKIKPSWPKAWGDNPYNTYVYAAIDGGAINNHPFEYVRYSLMIDPPHSNERDPATADRTVIMVNPFPEPPTFVLDNSEARDNRLLTIVRRLLPMFIAQNRFKPEEMVLALDEDVASRWIISPRRYVGQDLQAYGIACGLLGGFGGFADRAFREHDYELGRKNCQDFLARWFGVEQDNQNVSGGSLPQLSDGLPYNRDKAPILPLRGDAAQPVEVRPWPTIPLGKAQTVADKAAARMDKLIPKLLSENLNGIAWLAIRTWYATVGSGKVKDFVYYTCLADLTRRNQCGDFVGLSEDERKVLAACMEPAYDYRTPERIAHDLRCKVGVVTAAIQSLLAKKLLYQYFALFKTKEWYTYAPRGHFYDTRPTVD